MAVGVPSRIHAEHADRHDRGPVQRQEAVCGANEFYLVVVAATRAGVAHYLGDGQLADDVVQRRLQTELETLSLR